MDRLVLTKCLLPSYASLEFVDVGSLRFLSSPFCMGGMSDSSKAQTSGMVSAYLFSWLDLFGLFFILVLMQYLLFCLYIVGLLKWTFLSRHFVFTFLRDSVFAFISFLSMLVGRRLSEFKRHNNNVLSTFSGSATAGS